MFCLHFKQLSLLDDLICIKEYDYLNFQVIEQENQQYVKKKEKYLKANETYSSDKLSPHCTCTHVVTNIHLPTQISIFR